MDLLLVLAGLALLLAAGDLLVRGAVALGVRLGVPALVVGLTVVSLGTSAPELVVSVKAALAGFPGIAVGNVVGSNIANVSLVLALPALIVAVDPSAHDTRRSYAQMLAALGVMIGLCLLGPLRLWHAAVLLALLALVLLDMGREARRGRASLVEPLQAARGGSLGRALAFLAVGIVGLPLGAQLLIDGAVAIATGLGISDAVIGLTLVAIGTSLPELATTVAAAARGRADVAVGNVIGSNIFNSLGILGVISLFGPVPIDASFLNRDLWVMLAASLLLAPVVFRGWTVGRVAGLALLAAYAVYTWSLFGGPWGSA